MTTRGAVTDRLTFREWLRARGYSPTTVQNYTLYVRRAQEALSLGRATTIELQDWVDGFPGLMSKRQARKALLAFYTSRGNRNPARNIAVPPEPQGLPRPVSAEVRAMLIQAASDVGSGPEAFALLLIFTGCRFSEARTPA